MVLGGVATGSMKAKDELRVQGSMTYSGLRPMERDWGETQHCGVTDTENESSWGHHSEKHLPSAVRIPTSASLGPWVLCPLPHLWATTPLGPEG